MDKSVLPFKSACTVQYTTMNSLHNSFILNSDAACGYLSMDCKSIYVLFKQRYHGNGNSFYNTFELEQYIDVCHSKDFDTIGNILTFLTENQHLLQNKVLSKCD